MDKMILFLFLTTGFLVFQSQGKSVDIRLGSKDVQGPLALSDTLDLVWMVDAETLEVTFELTSKTTGWLGLGIAESGSMYTADMIIGGVQDGTAYFSDRYSVVPGVPSEDQVQDWVLLESSESDGQTILKFKRLLDTGDTSQDIAIQDENTYIIWAQGDTDTVSYHGELRGSVPVNIIHPIPAPACSTTFTNSLSLASGYLLCWQIDPEAEEIVFELTSSTVGWIGFGISDGGQMYGADVIIGGVQDGTSYFTDRFAVSHDQPLIDDIQDWVLLEASESDGQTRLKFKRKLETGDTAQDVPIQNKQTNFIWARGLTDEITYHETRCGVVPVNILQGP